MDNKRIDNLSPSEEIMYTTVRIECQNQLGNVSTGTGFYFVFNIKGQSVPLIFTNKHVVRGNEYAKFVIKLQSQDNQYIKDDKTSFHVGDFEKNCIMHPDENVDLCCLPIASIVNQMNEQNRFLFYKSFVEQNIITPEERKELNAIEDVTMIGYPNGLWDFVNNHPIMRHGKTATHPSYNYNGKEEFLIDAACFPGSSGSPVVLFNQGSYTSKNGSFIVGTRIKLLGILYAGPQMVNEGKIKVVDIPTRQEAISVSYNMINLGYIINAEKILDFIPILETMV